MFRGKRIISGIMLVLMLVSLIGCKKDFQSGNIYI